MKAENPWLTAVIDTNVWISGFLSKTGAPALLIRQLISLARPVFAMATYGELQDRLWRPEFDRYLSLEHRKQLLHDVDAVAQWITVPAEVASQTFSRNPDDDKFIHAALAAPTPYLISGDHDLTVLADELKTLDLLVLSPQAALQSPDFQTKPGRQEAP